MFLKKQLFVFFLTIELVAGVIPFAYASSYLNSFKGSPILDAQIDGVIGEEWDDAGSYPNVTINPRGTAHFFTKNDGSFLYIALNFTADSNRPWVAFQFQAGICMAANADGALLDHRDSASNGYQDIFPRLRRNKC